MKLSRLRACDSCSGPIVRPGRPQLHRIVVDDGFVLGTAANQVLGMTQVFQGSLALAEAMVPDPEVVKFLSEADVGALTELLFCADCYGTGLVEPAGLILHRLVEQRRRKVKGL